MIQIDDPISLLETHSTDMDEILLVSLQYKKYRFNLAAVYKPPRRKQMKNRQKTGQIFE